MDISPEKVYFVIVKAREFDVKVDVVESDPGSNASDDDMREVLEDFDDDPVYDELQEFIDGLNVDEQVDLVALAWLGRGTFDDWNSAREEAWRNRNDHTAGYLLGIPLLPDYLESGLAELGYSHEDYEGGRR